MSPSLVWCLPKRYTMISKKLSSNCFVTSMSYHQSMAFPPSHRQDWGEKGRTICTSRYVSFVKTMPRTQRVLSPHQARHGPHQRQSPRCQPSPRRQESPRRHQPECSSKAVCCVMFAVITHCWFQVQFKDANIS